MKTAHTFTLVIAAVVIVAALVTLEAARSDDGVQLVSTWGSLGAGQLIKSQQNTSPAQPSATQDQKKTEEDHEPR